MDDSFAKHVARAKELGICLELEPVTERSLIGFELNIEGTLWRPTEGKMVRFIAACSYVLSHGIRVNVSELEVLIGHFIPISGLRRQLAGYRIRSMLG